MLYSSHYVLVFQQLLFDVPGHRNIEGSCGIIPLEWDSAIQVAGPIFGEFVFFFQTIDQVFHMLSTNIFYAKLVNNKEECNRSGCVTPKARGVYTLIISVWFETLSEECIGQNTRLRESPNCAPNFPKDKAIRCVSVQIILFLYPLGE